MPFDSTRSPQFRLGAPCTENSVNRTSADSPAPGMKNFGPKAAHIAPVGFARALIARSVTIFLPVVAAIFMSFGSVQAQEPQAPIIAASTGTGADSDDQASKARQVIEQINQAWDSSVRPLLNKHCFECHSAKEHSGKLELEQVADLLRGGLSGSAVDPNRPAASLLLEVLDPKAKKHMPPEGQLSDEEITQLATWLENFNREKLPADVLAANWKATESTQSNPLEQPVAPERGSDAISSLPLGLNPSQVIDLALEASWQANDVKPSMVADDSVFARRVYLDLVGRIPRESELNQFVSNSDSRKREHLVDSLLSTEEHAQHLAEVFNAILMGRKSGGRKGSGDRSSWMQFLTTSIKNNRPWNDVAREVLLARPQRSEDQGAVWYLYARNDKHQDIAEAVSKDFFGVRIDCAQCHDHPLASEIEQKHYWGLVAFFNRSKNVDSPNGPRIAESAIGGFSEFTNVGGKSAENKLVYLRAKTIEEARPGKESKEEDRDELYLPPLEGEPKVPKFSRRQQFVDQVLEGNPLVAEAMVNRMWGWMFGRGLVHPVDALDSFHPASHPGLLDWLARDFEHSKYDVRRLIRHLALSRAYQLDSHAQAGSDPKWFAAALAKPLTAESLYRSFQVALDVTDPATWNSAPRREQFANLFPDVLTEESLANVSQGLWLTNSEPIREMVSAKNSKTIQEVLQIEEPDQLVERLFKLTLGRAPDEDELSHCGEFLASRIDERQQSVESLTWALLTSAEFRFNH